MGERGEDKDSLSELEDRLSKLEEENDILKIQLFNSDAEKVKMEEAKGRFVSIQINQNEKYIEKMEKEYERMEKHIATLRGRLEEVERENEILLSERSKGLLKEVIRQAEISKRKTGKNSFDM